MARRSQCSSAGDNPLDPNYLPPHYREEYRLAIDALVEKNLDGYYEFLQKADVVDFLSPPEIQYIQNSVRTPNQSNQPEQYFLESEGEGSSDTYWPVHSDLEVPGLDLGWPQMHAFIEPTEITTLVNPPEPDMPSIKEQARRLIKNAQQVIAIVMDIFTDVDMFADILNAASRRVAVYILLDEHNADHFINMVVNCRVNLQNFQFLRVRTVSGITYQCRSGKSLKGQMMDRFMLTDCRAVLSGNYSFMWSFEKLHRCMAHLFLGQLVTNFDEEFRILFAQSQPLIIKNLLAPVEDFVLPKTQYPTESSLMYREPRKFLSPDSGHSEEWARHSIDEQMGGDYRKMALKRHDSLFGPGDRFASQQPCIEPHFDQGPARILMTENPAFKRHSYAEGVHSRYSFPFLLQQGMPDSEPKGKHLYRGQQHYPGPEADNSGYDRSWNQDYPSGDQHLEPGLPQEVPQHENFDPVLNYLSSTRNLNFDQSLEKSLPASHYKRLNLAQSNVCQTSPTPSNSADQKQFYQHPATGRKDPTVKQGMRNWRISSYLSAYENPEEDLFLEPSQLPDAFEEPTNPNQQNTPGIGVFVPKMPNVKEFKVPATPRASQMPSYTKATAQVKPKKLQDEPVSVAVEIKVTPTPSESSSTNEGEKTEDAEQKEPKNTGLRREDSFRRKYNPNMQRNSRLKYSLIYSSLENQQTSQDATTADQHDEENDTNKTEQTKLPFVAHVFGQKKTVAREPFEWSCYTKSPTETGRSDDVSSKGNYKDSSKEDNSKYLSENPEGKEPLKQLEVERDTPSPSVPQTKPFKVEPPKIDQFSQSTKSLLTSSLYEDMSDPDQRLMFFKELAAKRKAAEAAKAEKEKEKAKVKPDSKTSPTTQKEASPPKIISEGIKSSKSEGLRVETPSAESSGRKMSTEACEPTSLHDSKNTKKEFVVSDSNTSKTCSEQEMKAGSEILKLNTLSRTSLAGSAETEHKQNKSLEEPTVPPLFKKDYLLPPIAQSQPSESELPKTDQPVQPAKPFIRKPLYVDMSDPDKRFMFFKDLAAKRKAAKAAEAEKEQIKPKVELKNSLTSQKKEHLPKLTSDDIKTSRDVFINPAAENVGKMVTMEACTSASSLLDDRENVTTKDSVANNDYKTGSEQENKFPVSEKTELSFIKSPEEPTVSDPFAEDGSHFPTHKNDIPADVLPVVQVTDERASLTLESTSEFVSVTSSPVECTMTADLHTNNQNPESVQLETSFHSVFPPDPDTGSEISSFDSLVQGSSSDHPLPISGSQNSPSITEEASPPDLSPEDSSSTPTPNKSSQNYNEAKVQEFISTPSQVSSQSTHETSQESDHLSSQTYLDSVPQSGSSESTSAADATNLESNISFERNIAGPGPNAVTPSTEGLKKDVSELEKECVDEECEAPESSEDIKADCTSPMISPSVPVSNPNVSDLESSVSKHDYKDTVIPTTSADIQSTQTAIKNTDFIPVTSLPGNAMTPPNIPPQTTLSTKLNLTDFDSPAETELCASLTESDQSVLPPETKTTDAILSVISSETQPKAEGSLVHQLAQSLSSSPEFTSETNLPCKTSETEKPSESQISEPTVPEERSEKEPEFVDTDEKTCDNSEDRSKSENICILEYVTSETANDQTNCDTCSESTDVTSKHPRLGQSRYSSSTANVLSSSNLRDDTKLLLEQISVNHQSRNESTKKLPVTDDEKEDKSDKKERGVRKFIGREPKLPQEREKLLERIQSMRKEKKIYSRFEV